MGHTATLSFVYVDPEAAARVERAIRPEVGDIDDDRAAASLSREAECLTVAVEATDLMALRAGLNTWCSLVAVAERAGGVVDS